MQDAAHLTVHTFRKPSGGNHPDESPALHVLQHIMGHASANTTWEYCIRVSDASTQVATEAYSRLVIDEATSGRKRDAEPCFGLMENQNEY